MTGPRHLTLDSGQDERIEQAAIRGGVLTVNLGTLDHPQTVAVILLPDKMREVLGVLGIETPEHLLNPPASGPEVIKFRGNPSAFDPARRR